MPAFVGGGGGCKRRSYSREGGIFFNVVDFSYTVKFRSNHCKLSLFRTKRSTYSVCAEPQGVDRGRGYFFDVGTERVVIQGLGGGGGGGEKLITELRYDNSHLFGFQQKN